MKVEWRPAGSRGARLHAFLFVDKPTDMAWTTAVSLCGLGPALRRPGKVKTRCRNCERELEKLRFSQKLGGNDA